MAGFAEDRQFTDVTDMEYCEKLLALAQKLEHDQQTQLVLDKLDCAPNMANAVTVIKFGKKYDKIDIGGSGKLMNVKETGEVFGIKGYGDIHKGHQYGTLDTIADWYWGWFSPVKMSLMPADHPASKVHLNIDKF